MHSSAVFCLILLLLCCSHIWDSQCFHVAALPKLKLKTYSIFAVYIVHFWFGVKLCINRKQRLWLHKCNSAFPIMWTKIKAFVFVFVFFGGDEMSKCIFLMTSPIPFGWKNLFSRRLSRHPNLSGLKLRRRAAFPQVWKLNQRSSGPSTILCTPANVVQSDVSR